MIVSTTLTELPLPTNDTSYAELLASPQSLIDQYSDSLDEVVVIGGQKLYTTLLPYTQKIYLTEIHRSYE